MEKSYLRYVCERSCGVVVSPRVNMVLDGAGHLICGAVRDVLAWEPRTGAVARIYACEPTQGEEGPGGEVVSLACDAETGTIAAAVACGLVRVWRAGDAHCVFEGHRAPPTALRFAPQAAMLCSGGANGDVVLWDVVAEKGVCRLRGHTGACSDVAFVGDWSSVTGYVVSCSRDATAKVWDVAARECVQTLSYGGKADAAPRTLGFDSGLGRLAAGGLKLELWAYDEAPGEDKMVIKALGAVPRRSNAPCLELNFVGPSSSSSSSSSGAVITTDDVIRIFAVLTAASAVEVYALRPASVAVKKMKRRLKRKREKGGGVEDEGDLALVPLVPLAQDEVEVLRVVHMVAPRCRSFVAALRGADALTIHVATRKNSVETHRVEALLTSLEEGEEAPSPTVVKSTLLDLAGHRSAVRSLGLSQDGEAVAAASAGGVKLWREGTCVRTLKAPNVALCVAFVRGDRAVLVGSKDGTLAMCDVATGDTEVVEDEKGVAAHAGAIWALDVSTTKKGGGGATTTALTGGADKDVKLWAIPDEGPVKQTETLRVGDDVLAVRFLGQPSNPKRYYVAVATLDACVRLLYADTLKFKISLYGHKLPALAIDGARDAELVATASADKTLKLWGLEFGELRRSVLAHDDAVTCVKFLASTHYVLTASKDGSIKQWDCDREEPYVQTFKRGHVGEVWALAVDAGAARVFSAGADRAVRSWRRTDQALFASEEADLDLENKLDHQEAARNETMASSSSNNNAVVAVARHTPAAERRAERLAEALELAQTEEVSLAKNPRHKCSPLMLGLDPAKYAMNRLALISPASLWPAEFLFVAELEPALLLLPVGLVATLLRFIVVALSSGRDDATVDVELCARVAVYALRVHHKAVAAHADLREPLAQLRDALRSRLDRDRRLYGTNLAAIRIANLKHAELASS